MGISTLILPHSEFCIKLIPTFNMIKPLNSEATFYLYKQHKRVEIPGIPPPLRIFVNIDAMNLVYEDLVSPYFQLLGI